jgi:hypothetical protein
MASQITSYLSTAPSTSRLEVRSEIQQTSDFASDQTTASAEQELTSASFESIDWGRLRGFERPPTQQKRYRPLKSHVWSFGWRLHKSSEGRDYWVCRLCHTGPSRPHKPAGSSFVCTESTSSAVDHLKKVHRIGPRGLVTALQSQPSNSSGGQSLIDGFIEASSASASTEAVFEPEVLRGYLVRLFTTEQLALSKINSPAFRDLLVYL